jgi:hypothetical protein
MSRQKKDVPAETHDEEKSRASDPEARVKPVFPKEEIQIPKFAGEPEELVEAWIRDFVRTTMRLRWTDEDRAANVEFYLRDTALDWCKTEYPTAPPDSWKKFCDQLRKYFFIPDYKNQLLSRLVNCSQRNNEPFKDFVRRLRELCDEVDEDMDEETRVNHFINKLRSPLDSHLLSSKLTSWSDAIALARSLEVRHPPARTFDSRQKDRPRGPQGRVSPSRIPPI